MKKIFLILMGVMVISCSNGNQHKNDSGEDSVMALLRLQNENRAKWQSILLAKEQEELKLYFRGEEALVFEIKKGNEAKGNNLVVAFYKPEAITSNKEVKKGYIPCRLYGVYLPLKERLESFTQSEIVTLREDGSRHHVKLIKVVE